MSKISKNSYSISLLEGLFLVFLVLKLVPGTVVNTSWSWWAVTSPLWVPILIAIAVLIIFFVIKAIIKISKWVMNG